MFCKNNDSVFGALYSKTKISTTNSTEVFVHDYFAPNYSAMANIRKFYGYKAEGNKCDIGFTYEMFARK